MILIQAIKKLFVVGFVNVQGKLGGGCGVEGGVQFKCHGFTADNLAVKNKYRLVIHFEFNLFSLIKVK